MPSLIETVRIRNGVAPLWYLHLRRLVTSCKALGVPLPGELLTPGGGPDRIHRLEGGPPLGLVPYAYPAEQLALDAGETLILVTDGITEAQDRHGTLFGHDRLLATIKPGGNANE